MALREIQLRLIDLDIQNNTHMFCINYTFRSYNGAQSDMSFPDYTG